MNGLTTIESKRRAVAPIIATLLMVAIAVVGGILIFVFTQGFFADDQVVGPTVDNIRIYGYDTTDSIDDAMDAGAADNTDLTCNSETAAVGGLAAGDCVIIFIENLGDKPVAIQAVRMFGQTHTAVAGTDATCGASGFAMFEVDGDNSSDTISILDPNERASICVVSAVSNNVKVGRTIPVQVETSNGQSSQINMINGALRGQQAS